MPAAWLYDEKQMAPIYVIRLAFLKFKCLSHSDGDFFMCIIVRNIFFFFLIIPEAKDKSKRPS